MPLFLRLFVAFTLLLVAPMVEAAEPAPPLATVLPASATIAFNLRRDGLAFVRHQLDDEPAMRGELHDFLVRTVGVDLSAADGISGWVQTMDPPVGAVLLTLPAQGDFRGPVVGDEGGVPLHAFGQATAALLPRVGVLIGSEPAVRDGIRAQQRPVWRATWLSAFDAGADLQIVALADAFRDPQIASAAQQFGAQWASLTMRHDGRFRLEIAGDAKRLQGLLQLAETVAKMTIERLQKEKERLAQGDDVLAGVGAISSYHSTRRLWQELHPKLVGDRLVSDYQMPDMKMSGMLLPTVGIMAAVAVPAFMKYMRRARASEATANLHRLDQAIAAWTAEHKRKPLPPSTEWTPARGCCGQPKDACAPDAAAWNAAAWKAFGFSVADSHYYQYRYTRQSGGRYTIEARGDLDCDGKFSSYKQSGKAGGDSDPIEVTNDLE